MRATKFPIRSIHRQDVAAFWFRDPSEKNSSCGSKTKSELQEEILQTSIPGRLRAIAAILKACEMGEINSSPSQNSVHEKRKSLEASSIAIKLLREGPKKLFFKQLNFEGPSSSSTLKRVIFTDC